MREKRVVGLTGKQRQEKKWNAKALEIVHPNAAGVDVGGKEHWVAISPERDEEPVRRFGCFTADLEQMAVWLKARGIESVVMQSTGVYWIPLYEILEQSGLRVWLVNARHTKNVPGRKSDIQECQWLLKLHTFGLLNNSFQPTDQVRVSRTLWRHRNGLVTQAGSAIQRMQKALVEMNVQLHTVISDLSGMSGMAILKAIVGGERNPKILAGLADGRVRASKEEIAKSLHGNWRSELLLILGQELKLYEHYRGQIAECDRELQKHLKTLSSKAGIEEHPLGPRPKGKASGRNAPQFDLRSELYRISGVDWSQVNGIDVQVAQTVISEVGVDMSAFPSERHFASWLGLSPTNEQSGGKILNRRTRKVVNRATVAFPPQCGIHTVAKSKLPGRAISATTNATGSAESDHGDGAKTSLSILPATALRPTVCR